MFKFNEREEISCIVGVRDEKIVGQWVVKWTHSIVLSLRSTPIVFFKAPTVFEMADENPGRLYCWEIKNEWSLKRKGTSIFCVNSKRSINKLLDSKMYNNLIVSPKNSCSFVGIVWGQL